MSINETIRDYVNGIYEKICNYSRNQDETVDEKTKLAAQELAKTIDQQPIEEKSLVRVERLWDKDNIEIGNVINFGIASTSRNKELFNLFAENKVDGLSEYQDDCRYVEYRFENSRSLDISKQSDFDQQEELIHGKYKVVNKYWQPAVAKTSFEEIELSNYPIVKTRLSKRGLKVFTYLIDGKKKNLVNDNNQSQFNIIINQNMNGGLWN